MWQCVFYYPWFKLTQYIHIMLVETGSWPGTLGIWKRAWTTTGQQHYVEPEDVKNTANYFPGNTLKYFQESWNTENYFLAKQWNIFKRILNSNYFWCLVNNSMDQIRFVTLQIYKRKKYLEFIFKHTIMAHYSINFLAFTYFSC